MNKIISMLKTTEFENTIYVVDIDNKRLEEIKVNANNLINNLFDLIKEYNVEEISLFGNDIFLEGIKKQIQKEEITKYNTNNLKIYINLMEEEKKENG